MRFFFYCVRSSQIDSFCHNQLRVKVICINCSCGTYGNVLNVRVPVQLTSAMFPALLEGFTSLLHAHLKQITSMQIHSVQSHETTLYGAKLLCPGPCLTHNDLQFLGFFNFSFHFIWLKFYQFHHKLLWIREPDCIEQSLMLRKAFNTSKDLGRWHVQVTGVVHLFI